MAEFVDGTELYYGLFGFALESYVSSGYFALGIVVYTLAQAMKPVKKKECFGVTYESNS